MGLPGGISPSILPGRLADLVRVPIDYIMEIHVNGKLHKGLAITLPLTPENVRRSRPPATSTEFTLGLEPIREHSLNRHQSIELVGRSGLQARSGYNAKGEIVYKGGRFITEEFDKFLNTYQELAAKKGAYYLREDDPYREHLGNVALILRMLKEDVHVKVEVQDWQMSSSAQRSRHSYEWVLSLRAYAPAKRKVPTNLFAPVNEWMQTAADAIALANAVGAMLDNAIQNTRADLDSLRAPLRELQNSAKLARQIVGSTRELARFPQDVLSDLAYVAEGFAEAWNDAEVGVREFSLTGDFKDRLQRIGWMAEDAARNAVTVAGATGGGPSGRASAANARSAVPFALRDEHQSGNTPERRRGFRDRTAAVYQLRSGDTLRTIAAAVYGSPERWLDIAYFNGWIDAYRDASGRPGRAGDTILLPGVGTDIPIERAETVGDVFGCDLYLDPDTGDLEILGDDFRTIRGRDNLEQALRHRLTTTQGEARLFPAYGLPVAPGDAFAPRMLGYIAAHVREQLSAEPRILEIQDLEVLDEGDTLSIQFTAIPSDGASLTVIAPMASNG